MSDRGCDRRHPLHLPPRDILGRPTIVFVTVCTARRKPILARVDAVATIVDAWRRAEAWRIGRYVIMPDHVHFFCSPFARDVPLQAWVAYWKSITSRSWPHRREQPVWQRHFWDWQLRVGESYLGKWEYVKQNPVRGGLVDRPEAWPFAGELNELEWT